MATLLDLPPELLLRIFQQFGSGSNYTDKERQTDLARIAPVCKAFHAATIPLLYSDTVNVRSAGRTFLLARTLAAQPALAPLVHTLVAQSIIDSGHAPSVLALLRGTPNLASLTLGGVFLTLHGSPEMRAALASKRLTSLSYGFSAGSSGGLVCLAPFLQAFTALEHLALRNVPVEAPAERWTAPPGAPATFRALGPPPMYELRSFEVHNERGPVGTQPWSLRAVEWALGASSALTSLSLSDFPASFSLTELFDALAARGCGRTLRRLTLRQFEHRARTRLVFVPRGMLDPNALGAWFPSLSHLVLEETPGAENFALPAEGVFRPPGELRVLELHGGLHRAFALSRMLEGGKGALGKIRLVGPYPTDPDVKELRLVCEEAGVILEAARSFQS
ncbi:hypothetical protein JCM10450v2_004433 [Rhodotorula kratochvilovae]